ncbi:5253_t:CDS:2 [Ambispora gerdemannii]|uniref:5253_t:CDS:1 n=1 Tax=Ambispora gerdemannii TaxID=144530 RepID=A0A9N9D7G2_9GLOM|nr:5253_t:CDS:2 [Ambispora gerdemannii]
MRTPPILYIIPAVFILGTITSLIALAHIKETSDFKTHQESVSPYLWAGLGIVFAVCLSTLTWQLVVVKKIRDKKKVAIDKLLQEFNKEDNPNYVNWRFAETPNTGAIYQNVLLIEIGEPPMCVINISEAPELEKYLNNGPISSSMHSSI